MSAPRRRSVSAHLAICGIALGLAAFGCSENAVVVAREIRRLAPIVDAVEVFEDRNGDGTFAPDERVFVVDPRAATPKAIRISFLAPQSRRALLASGSSPFLEFASFFDPSPAPWVERIFFDDDPADGDPDGPAASVATYRLHDDLVDPSAPSTTGAVPVRATLALSKLDPALESAGFVFVLARQPAPTGPPPRIVAVRPAPPAPFLPGWGRPIAATDFEPGDDLAAVLARVDQNFLGTALGERVSPHSGVSLSFDDPMSNLVVSVTPSPARPTDPRGIDLSAGTFAFLNPFTEATSDTSIGMAPDAIYEIQALASFPTVPLPIGSGTQNDQGQPLMPSFDDALYASLRGQGFSDRDLAGDARYRFRTGPVRITRPAHLGATNATTAPGGRFVARLQLARPAEGIDAPTSVDVRVSPRGLPPSDGAVVFPPGVSDRVQQDGFVRIAGVTAHEVAIQLPAASFDDQVEVTVVVAGASGVLGSDTIRFRHDVIVPTIDLPIDFTNTYTDGQLDRVCLVSDCDVARFEVQVPGGAAATLARDRAEPATCAASRERYCFKQASLGLAPGAVEGPTDVTFVAVDDQGNRSDARTIHTEPICQRFDKFVGPGGKLSAIATGERGDPRVAWLDADGRTLRYAEPQLSGAWTQHASTIFQIAEGHSFGLGIDMVIDPADRRAVVCFVDAPGDPTASAAGRLHVMELGAGGQWFEISAKDGVRPVGCSLTTKGFQVIAGWVEGSRARFGLALALEQSARDFPPTPSLPLQSGLIRDLDIAQHGNRLYYTYRTSHTQVGLAVAPGSIVAGYVEGAISHAQLVCPPGAVCPQFGGQILGNDVSPVTLGFGPRLVADDLGLGLAFVSVEDHGDGVWERNRALEVLQAEHPDLGLDLDFARRFRNDDPPAIARVVSDGVSLPANGVEAPFGPVSLVRGHDGRLIAGWVRGEDLAPGAEEVAIARVDGAGAGEVTRIERRVSTAGDLRREAVAVELSSGRDGYDLVYRNPLTDRLEFAAEQETLPLDPPVVPPGGTFACPGAWETSQIRPDEMSLRYAQPSNLWDAECAGVPALPRPWSVGGFPDEKVGQVDSLLRDLAVGLKLRDGRGLLKAQRHVCLPRSVASGGQPDFTVCDPNLGGAELFDPPTVSQSEASTIAAPTPGVPPVATTEFPTLPEANAACPPAGQIVTEFIGTGTITCVECPAGRAYSPATRLCVSCPGADFLYRGREVRSRPRFLSGFFPGGVPDLVQCAACPDTAVADRERGRMPFVVSADGATCSRCTPGSQPSACVTDEDCLVYGEDARCAAAGWQQRHDRPAGRICVPRCHADADCHGGRCDRANGGICRAIDGAEQPAGTDFLCRPIGCDECWHDDFCSTDADCPENHGCYTGDETGFPVLSPVCVLRPLVSPTFERFVETLPIPAADLARLKARLAEQRENLRALLATVRIPNEVEVPIPIFSDRVVAFSTDVEDIRLTLGNGVAVIRLDMSEATFQNATPIFVRTDGPWSISFVYALYAEPRDGGSRLAYSGLGFDLVEVLVDGEIEVPGPNKSLAPLAATIQSHLGPFAGDIMKAITDALGGLQVGPDNLLSKADLVRCMFVPFGVQDALPRECRSHAFPQIWNVAADSELVLHYEACR